MRFGGHCLGPFIFVRYACIVFVSRRSSLCIGASLPATGLTTRERGPPVFITSLLIIRRPIGTRPVKRTPTRPGSVVYVDCPSSLGDVFCLF